jgi:hypothetical protein
VAEPISDLLVWTLCDALVGDQDSEIHEAVPDSRLVVAEKCGHGARLEYQHGSMPSATPGWRSMNPQKPPACRGDRVH